MIVKALVFYIVFVICTYISGVGITALLRRKSLGTEGKCEALISCISTGFASLTGVVTLAGIICSALKLPYIAALGITALFAVGMAAVALVRGGRGRNSKAEEISVNNNEKADKKVFASADICLLVIMLALVVIQIIAVVMFETTSGGNIHSIYNATAVYDMGAAGGPDGLMYFWGAIGRVLGMHPMILVLTYLPVILIPFYYCVYYDLLNKILGGNNTGVLSGLIAICLLNIWGYQSVVLVPVTLLLSYGTYTCFAIHAFLPELLAWFVSLELFVQKPSEVIDAEENLVDIREELETDEFYQEEWDMKKHKIINARNLAIALAVLTVALVAFVLVLNNKINTLHAATANLQEDLYNRCRIYEYVTQTGTVEGYLIKGADGKLTMIGGGTEENAEELADFLVQYGDHITNWYFYDSNAEEMGAYAKCVLEKGMTVENVYILNRTEIEGLK